jgi:hypothetical protein
VIQWDYQVRSLVVNSESAVTIQKKLAEYGKVGWELVGIFPNGSRNTYNVIFKRPLGFIEI